MRREALVLELNARPVRIAYLNGIEAARCRVPAPHPNDMTSSRTTARWQPVRRSRIAAAAPAWALCFVTAAAPGPGDAPQPDRSRLPVPPARLVPGPGPGDAAAIPETPRGLRGPPADEQAISGRVLQNYQTWLARLPDADRELVYFAPTRAERLAVVRRLREAERVATLPAPLRLEHAALTDETARRKNVAAWRAEMADRPRDLAVAQRNWPEFQPGRLPPALQNESPAVTRFAENLRPALSDEERRQLDQAEDASREQGLHYPFFFLVANHADAHPLCPGRVGPKDFASLPPDVVSYLVAHEKAFKKKGDALVPVEEDVKELRRAVGRWPDFAIELTRYCRRHGLTDLPALGDCRELEMPPEVREALKRLRDQSKRKEVREQLDHLATLEAPWPTTR